MKNKIGSAVVAGFSMGEVICVTSTDKIEEVVGMEDVEENDEVEVVKMWDRGIEGVKVRNVYFEWVEGRYVGRYITERGVLGKRELLEIHQERVKWQDIWEVLG